MDNAIKGLPVQVVGPAPPGILLHNTIKVKLHDSLLYDVVYDIAYDVVCYIAYDVVYDIVYDIVGISSSCMKGCKSAGPCLWNLVLLSTCVSIFLQLFSELGSLTCDADCALKTRATPTLSHTPSDSVDLCRDRLVHKPPL